MLTLASQDCEVEWTLPTRCSGAPWAVVHPSARKAQEASLQLPRENATSLITGAETAPEGFEQYVRQEFLQVQHAAAGPSLHLAIRSFEGERSNVAEASAAWFAQVCIESIIRQNSNNSWLPS